MNKPFLFSVIWKNAKGESKQFDTDSEHTALWTATRRNGEIYIDTRHEARLRLYNFLINKKRI